MYMCGDQSRFHVFKITAKIVATLYLKTYLIDKTTLRSSEWAVLASNLGRSRMPNPAMPDLHVPAYDLYI